MLQRQGQRLRRLSNILGCRDPDYAEPSISVTPDANLDDSTTSGARMDDDDITSGANLEDHALFSPEVCQLSTFIFHYLACT
jgi:hypothetical protein